jgi:hypothetical protein
MVFSLGKPYVKPPKHPTASFKRLHMWYKTYAPLQEQFRLDPLVAAKTFDEVIAGLTEKEARYEAQTLPELRQLFRMRRLLWCLPRRSHHQTGSRKRIPLRSE